MSTPSISLAFMKFNTADMDGALKFYGDVFGYTVTRTFDEPEFLEHIMTLPGQENGPSLMLVQFKDGRDVSVGPGHGPIGLVTDQIEALYDKALAAGGKGTVPVFSLGTVKVAIVLDPEGHEIEFVQHG